MKKVIKRGLWVVSVLAWLPMPVFGQAVPPPAAASAAAANAASAVNQGLDAGQSTVTQPPTQKAKPSVPAVLPPRRERTEGAPVAVTGRVQRVEVLGDGDWMRSEGLLSRLEKRLVGSSESADRLRQHIAEVERQAISNGFYLASLRLHSESNGTLRVEADKGRVGQTRVTFLSDPAGGAATVAEGRYFSARQIQRRFRGLEPGQTFNYFEFYDRFYQLNSHPDLTANVDLRVPRSGVADPSNLDGTGRRVDLELSVTERLPLHGVFDLDNYGTDAADEWMARVTLQHLNLTRADDVLTLNGQVALDGASLYGMAASYQRPHSLWNGGAVTLHGGYTEVDAEDVVPLIDVTGEGWFAGLQGSLRLFESPARLLTGSFGFVQRYVENALVVEGYPTLPNEVTIRPFSLALLYSDKKSDRWHGRNYATFEAVYNIGDFLGTSDDEEFQLQRVNAESDYFIFRGQVARTQTFGGTRVGDDYRGRWVAFAKLEAQVADGPLVHAEQMGIGGANSVRGYKEREFLGDHGVSGTLEIRTPILLGVFSRLAQYLFPRWTPADVPADRLQLVTFADVGYISVQDALPGQESSETLVSAGAGFRLAVTQYSQLKFDWGFPLEETSESESSGRAHLNFQLQF